MTDGNEIARQKALQALNATGRDRHAARRLYMQWLRENEDLLEAVSGPAVTQLITSALSRDITIERRDVLEQSRAMPVVENGVSVGEEPEVPRRTALPVPSEESRARTAARVLAHSCGLADLHLFPLPVTGRSLGEVVAWEVKDAYRYYMDRVRGDMARALFFRFVWEALPDREKPAKEQQPVYKQLDVNTLRLLDRRALKRAKSADVGSL